MPTPIFEVSMNTEQKIKTKKPSMYNVILYNDDMTPFEFVEAVLLDIFKKNKEEVLKITQEAHNKGKTIVGTYIYDVAFTRCKLAMNCANQNGFPLKLKPVAAE